MSGERLPVVGDLVIVRGGPEGAPVTGWISRVWTDGNVNVTTSEHDEAHRFVAIPFVREGATLEQRLYCEFAPHEAPKPAPAKFRFSLGATPAITVSGEIGLVVGRAEYLNSEPSYLLQYRRNDGIADEQWWRESALT